MTTEEKELLLKDLSARLPYEVKCEYENTNDYSTLKVISKDKVTLRNNNSLWHSCDIENVKPYLFPFSSMTENQKKEFNNLTTSIKLDSSEIGSAIDYNMDIDINEYSYVSLEDMITCIDWLNAHHFDFRRLLEKELAIDATGLNIY